MTDPYASSSSAVSARSVATAWPSSNRIACCSSMRLDVPRSRHARHRPGAARLHLAARERRSHRRRRRHARPRGSRRRAAVPAARAELPDLRFGASRSVSLATASKRPGCWARPTLVVVDDGERRMIGPFDVEFIPVTHSVPHAHAIAIHTPQGVILHSGDFKLDLTPVDGRRTDLARIGAIASNEGIRLLMADSTNAEEARPRPVGDQRRFCAARTVRRADAASESSPPASPATCTASSRSPMPRSPRVAWSRRSG